MNLSHVILRYMPSNINMHWVNHTDVKTVHRFIYIEKTLDKNWDHMLKKGRLCTDVISWLSPFLLCMVGIYLSNRISIFIYIWEIFELSFTQRLRPAPPKKQNKITMCCISLRVKQNFFLLSGITWSNGWAVLDQWLV